MKRYHVEYDPPEFAHGEWVRYVDMEAAVIAEREACAEIAQACAYKIPYPAEGHPTIQRYEVHTPTHAGGAIAHAIRARGMTTPRTEAMLAQVAAKWSKSEWQQKPVSMFMDEVSDFARQLERESEVLRKLAEAIAGGDGDAQEMARQTLALLSPNAQGNAPSTAQES